jgi:hypothetical protein
MKRAPFALLIALPVAVAGGIVLRAMSPPQPLTPAPLVAPPAPDNHLLTCFTVTDAPERIQQVLMIVDFPPRTWTPLHTPGGSVYNTVIDGHRRQRPRHRHRAVGRKRAIYDRPAGCLQ